MAKKPASHFIVIEHLTGYPIQQAGVDYMFDTYDAAVDDIIDSLYNNGELNDDGSATVKIHTYGLIKKLLKTEAAIRKAMKSSTTLIVNSDCQVMYDIIELFI